MSVLAPLMVLAGCVSPQPLPVGAIQGANLLQTSLVSFESGQTRRSLENLRSLGANTVAVVYFLHQPGAGVDHILPGNNVTESQLRAAIRHAHRLKLAVAIKPQILVSGAWAGAIDPGSDAAWQRWFSHYRRTLLWLAAMAEREGVAMMFVGTELARAAERPEWARLIRDLRGVYRGHLTYAAHGPAEAQRFRHWSLLDSIGVTLYEPMDVMTRAARTKPDHTLAILEKVGQRYRKPVLIAELGIPSAEGAGSRPWEVPHRSTRPDPEIQAGYLRVQINRLARPWISGVLVWCWYSDPKAGGLADTDFTIQNKPAAQTLACHWRDKRNC